MQRKITRKDVEQLLAEADELIRKINSDAIHDLPDEKRPQFESHAQALKQLRSEAGENPGVMGKPESGSFGKGMHEAIDEIVKAIKQLAGHIV